MPEYFTTGQVARKLRISVSTLKRWISYQNIIEEETRNASGWMLFTDEDVSKLKKFKNEKGKNGKMFSRKTLKPV